MRSIPQVVADTCREYARLEIRARLCEREGHWWLANSARGSARFLYDIAMPEAQPELDAIKQVLEIDTATTDINSVLWRATFTLED